MRRDALVVGINQYPFLKDTPTSPAKHLTTPATDAEAIAQLLETHGNFRVKRFPSSIIDGRLQVNPNPDKPFKTEELEQAILDLFLPETEKPPETALLFFAGHGLRKQLRTNLTQGFLAVSDSCPSKNQWGFSLGVLWDILQPSQVKQQIIWLDCCFSGELLNFKDSELGRQSSGCDRFLIAASRDYEVAYQQLDGEHGVLSSALLAGLDPDQVREFEWITNRTLTVAVEEKLQAYYETTKIPQSPLISNHGEAIKLIQGRAKPLSQSDLEEVSPYSTATDTVSIDVLVQQVRSRIHDDIQKLHSTMPLWGVDRWVPLGDLFVDVNILEELNSSRRSELDELWQDFSKNPSDRSLDRIGLGKERQRVSGQEVLAKNTNLMVVGKPGSGKTTYLQRIVTECNADNLQAYRIPTLIKLREFVEDGRKFSYSLERYFEQCWQLSNTEINLIFHQGRALVLLDGLDEVTGEDGKNITKQIKQFARSYPQVQVILTYRTQSQESRFERFDYVEVADFNQAQVRLFAEHWFVAVMKDESAGLKRSNEFLSQLFLEANKPIRDLAITPILLSLTCAVFHHTGKFYSKRSQLYEEGLELLLEWWDKSREIERDEIYRDLSPERKLELLSYLAVKKFEQPQYVLFEQAEIEGYIAEFLGIGLRDSRVVLRAIEAQHGLLIERAQKVWSFSHLTFQEYLSAKSIITSYASEALDQILEELTIHIYEKQWREIFLLAVEILNDSNSLILVKLMRIKLNEILHKSNKIQQLLTWVNQKSLKIDQSRTLSYSKLGTSIRAFYCANTFDHALNLNRPSDYTGDSANALAETLNPNFSLSNIFTIALDCERKFSFDHNLVLDRALTGILTLAIDIKEALSLDSNWPDTNLYIPTLASCFHDIINNKVIFFKPNSNLEQSLKNLKEELPNPDSPGLVELWQGWTYKLRNTLIKYRDIGHIWQLDKDEIKKIQIYFDANKLLVECLEIIKKKRLRQIYYYLEEIEIEEIEIEEIEIQVEEIEANLLLPLDDT